MGFSGLQGTRSIGQPSPKTRQSEHRPKPGAHQDDGCFLEYRLQVHEDAGDARELLQEPHPHRDQDGLVNEGVLDLSTGNPPALEGTKPQRRGVTTAGRHRGTQKTAQELPKGGWILQFSHCISPVLEVSLLTCFLTLSLICSYSRA